MTGSLSLIMDIVLLAFLAATIFYAYRLSRSLDSFRKYRQEFSRVIQDLSRNIEKAERSIKKLKETSKNSGRDLQDIIDEGRMLADELQLIHDAGDNLATRLENLAAQKSKTSAGSKALNGKTKQSLDKEFMIRDPDFDPENQNSGNKTKGDSDDLMDEAGVPEELQSKAEKELYAALQKSKKH